MWRKKRHVYQTDISVVLIFSANFFCKKPRMHISLNGWRYSGGILKPLWPVRWKAFLNVTLKDPSGLHQQANGCVWMKTQKCKPEKKYIQDSIVHLVQSCMQTQVSLPRQLPRCVKSKCSCAPTVHPWACALEHWWWIATFREQKDQQIPGLKSMTSYFSCYLRLIFQIRKIRGHGQVQNAHTLRSNGYRGCFQSFPCTPVMSLVQTLWLISAAKLKLCSYKLDRTENSPEETELNFWPLKPGSQDFLGEWPTDP